MTAAKNNLISLYLDIPGMVKEPDAFIIVNIMHDVRQLLLFGIAFQKYLLDFNSAGRLGIF